MNKVLMAHSILVLAVFQQSRIGQACDERLARDVVHKDLVRPTRCCVLAIRRHSHRIDGIQARRQRLPLDLARGTNLAFRALLNPELNQRQLLRAEIFGAGLVVLGRHGRVFGVRGGQEQETFHRLTGHHEIRLGDVLGRFQNHIGLGLGLVVTSQTIGPEDRQNFILKIHRRLAVQADHRQRGLCHCADDKQGGGVGNQCACHELIY